MKRLTLIKIHMLLASFMLPAAFMFLLTGGLYTWGIKGSYNSESTNLALSTPLQADAESLQALVEKQLATRGLSKPSGKAKIKKGGTSYKLEWTGSDLDVVLEPTADPMVATLTIKDTTWYRNFVQLHKAKGGTAFKVYAAALAIALFIILLSGFIMSVQVPALKRQALLTSVIGLLTFVAVVLLS